MRLSLSKFAGMTKLLRCLGGALLLLFIAAACHDDDDDIPREVIKTNEWILESMEEIYFWNKLLPDSDPKTEPDSKAYFDKLLYKDDDWSWITDDYASLQAEYDGVPVTMGFDVTPVLYSDNVRIFMVVNYVYPGSPAAAAGLKRGDIFVKVDGQLLTRDNYADVYSKDSYSIEMATVTANENEVHIVANGTVRQLTAAVTKTDPAIHAEVIDTLGYKIGYLAYAEFVAGANDIFLKTLDDIFTAFKAENITELIVDLRYNPGGDLVAAGHLASLIAPKAVVEAGNPLISLQYNDQLQEFFEGDPEYDDQLHYRLSNLASNADLKRVYFLTTQGTASASELVITGLDPYMEVVKVGEATYGKYVGAWLWPDDDEKWCMVPIVMKYRNADGYTDFADGLTPDYEMYDQVVFMVPLGDTADPMIKTAIEDIAGVPQSVATRSGARLRSGFTKIIPQTPEMKLRRNLYVPAVRELFRPEIQN